MVESDAATPAVKLTFLGSGDTFGSGGRFQACLALDVAGARYLIDCGTSALIAMRRFAIDPDSVRAILVSHLHGDHFGGIPFLLLDAHFRRRAQALRIVGPPGTEARVAAAMEALFPGSTGIARRFAVTFTEFEHGREVVLDDVRVTPYTVIHASGAPPFALRVAAGGRTIGYSGDTEWTASLVEVAREADLFVCEAYALDKPIKYHLDFRTLAAHRGELTCRRMILTHMSGDMLDQVSALDVEAAADGMSITL